MKIARFAMVLSLAVPAMARAADWPQFRGPVFQGSSPEQGLPVTFGPEEGVRWRADLPGRSAATPAVWGEHVFVSTTNEEKGTLEAWCLDGGTGAVRWKKEVAQAVGQDDRSNYASPSPAADGERAYFFFGNGDLVAFSYDGGEVWRRNIQQEYGRFAFLWTFSSSPVVHGGRLYLQVLQRDESVNGRGFADRANDSYLLCLDPATGKEVWKVTRPSGAVAESREAFSTPVIHTHAGRTELIVAGGDAVTGHDPETGRELWRWGTWNPDKIGHWRLVPSPLACEGVVLVCAPKREPVYAVRLGGSGDLGPQGLVWKSEGEKDVSSDVSTPAYADGLAYVLHSDRQSMACIRPATGEVVWAERLESSSKFEASPTVADGKIYLINHRGDVMVLRAGEKFEVLHTASFGESRDELVRASVAVAGGALFVRTDRKLYCIGG